MKRLKERTQIQERNGISVCVWFGVMLQEVVNVNFFSSTIQVQTV